MQYLNKIDKKTHEFLIQFFSVWVFLLSSLLLGVWIMQNSINAYVMQTYHKPNVLALKNPIWQKGAEIGDGLMASYHTLAHTVDKMNTEIINAHNASIISQSSEQLSVLSVSAVSTLSGSLPNSLSNSIVNSEPATLALKDDIPLEPKNNPSQSDFDNEVFVNSLTLNKNDKVFFAGDSMMQGVAPHMQKYLQARKIDSINLSKQSTGLSYPKLFDWNKTIKQTINKDKNIKLLIVMLGPNDPWDFYKEGRHLKFGSDEWKQEYQSRMSDIIDFAKSKKVSIIWVTPPNMKKDKLNAQMNKLNDIMSELLIQKQVKVVDSRPIMGGKNNTYQDYLNKDGKSIKMRTNDGIHFTPEGQRILAKEIQSLLTIESL